MRDDAFDIDFTLDIFGERQAASVATDTADTTSSVPVANQPPIADAGGPYTVEEGTPVFFRGSAFDPDSGGPLTYQWDFDYRGGEFHSDVSGVDLAAPSYVYPFEGTFVVALRVQDSDGAVSDHCGGYC